MKTKTKQLIGAAAVSGLILAAGGAVFAHGGFGPGWTGPGMHGGGYGMHGGGYGMRGGMMGGPAACTASWVVHDRREEIPLRILMSGSPISSKRWVSPQSRKRFGMLTWRHHKPRRNSWMLIIKPCMAARAEP